MDNQSYTTYTMELHVSYCIYSKIAKKIYVWRDKKGLGGKNQ